MKHFSLYEFCRSPTAARLKINMIPPPHIEHNIKMLVEQILDPLREYLANPIRVTSGWRPYDLNEKIGGAKSSQHVLGEAADIQVRLLTPKQVCEAIVELNLPFDQLINEFDSWTHVSYGPKNRRQKLKAVKFNGSTRYINVEEF